MGLKNKLFGNKRDYAQEFKDTYLKDQLAECTIILSDWHNHTNHDANLDYADLIFASRAYQVTNKDFFEKAEYLFDHPDSNCENPSLTNWYKTTAKKTIMKAKSKM